MRNGYKHNIPLSLNIKPFRKTPALQSFAITPSMNYNGIFYSKQTYKWISGYDYEYDESGNLIDSDAIISDTLIGKFSYAQIVHSTPESRCEDARRCRLAAFGAALRNRDYDQEEGDDTGSHPPAIRHLTKP